MIAPRNDKDPLPPLAGPAPAAPAPVTRDLPWEVVPGDCLAGMKTLPDGCVDLAFADPPFNIGYEYDAYVDRKDEGDYLAWCDAWTAEVHRVLKADGTFWLAIGDAYAAELRVLAKRLGFVPRSWVVWFYTFGVNCTANFTKSHTHLHYFVKDPRKFTFNADDPAARVPSARQLVYNDKRADPSGRLPDDTWVTPPDQVIPPLEAVPPTGEIPPPGLNHNGYVLRPQDLPGGFGEEGDTWYVPRIAGTHKQRAGFHGCQMPERVLERIVRLCSNPGELVLDPFTGSGTTGAVAKKLGRRFLGYELSEVYAAKAAERIAAVSVGDPIDGPVDPLTSAPKTGKGRKKAGATTSA